MKGSFGLTLSVAVTLALVLQLSHYPVVDASRDADVTSMEVSGSHFVAQKNENRAGSRPVLSEIREHREEPSQGEITNEMRQKIAAFSKLAVQALANGDNPDMSREEKAQNVQLALAQATNAMASLASHEDIEKNPVLAQKLSNLQARSAPSLIQKHQEGSKPMKAKITPEMREKVAAFGKAAVQALAKGRNPAMGHDEKAKSINAALGQAANALLSITSVADMKNAPELAQKLAGLKELASPSLIQKREEPASGARMTPEMREQVAAFSDVAVQALANGNNADMSHEEQAEHVQVALAKAANVMASMASMVGVKNTPGLAEKVAHFKELTAPSLIQQGQENKLGNTRSAKITPDMHQNVIAFGKAAAEALANGRNIAMTPEAKAQSTQAALAQAVKAILSITSAADTKNSPELAQKLASLEELASPSLIQTHEDPECPEGDCSKRKIKDVSAAGSKCKCKQEISDDLGGGVIKTWTRCKPPSGDPLCDKDDSSKSGGAAPPSGGSSQTGAKKTGDSGGVSSATGAKMKKKPKPCTMKCAKSTECCSWKASALPSNPDKMECKAKPCAWKPEMAKWNATAWEDWQTA